MNRTALAVLNDHTLVFGQNWPPTLLASLADGYDATLRRAGLVTSRREGRWVYYQLSDEGVGIAGDFLEQLKTSGRELHAADYCPEPDTG